MKGFLKIIFWVSGGIAVLFLMFIFFFRMSMEGNDTKLEEIMREANVYVKEKFQKKMTVLESFYDSGGNFPYFDYAAKVRSDEDENLVFFVFYNEKTEQLEDSYVSSKWEKVLQSDLAPYLKKEWGTIENLSVFYDERVGYKLNIDANKIPEYHQVNEKPTILFAVPRKIAKMKNILIKRLILSKIS
ncbi:hypothetical protein [Aneurinibacillus migulanus]|uniref:Uncharacterized protein n=1 Tax=Aneurinibacillus migulanus TaxID=47500 RepID=A0A0D1VBB1_ANEMI|nr:hypothetical protein [Aneurinibacillus migulanus]KIV56714.1 hypothetical protein TS65_11445 [Aneurinibacillus migulanus]KON97124.1 hypothetical protein AF333_18295 [Aneurinibacillus migulanus]MED0896318.1 hypothetical protein [Aneurinibacillus migulanus]MED1618639.1 hypothetical protein [Aneurinibacillus migulanus]SDK02627.1 hypothetical protein SAMN04487909_13613 [Aneurinibacillus migulanus]